MSYVQGEDRGQAALLPAAIEDYVAADAPVRVIDAFVDGLDVRGLGFGRSVPAVIGRPPAFLSGDPTLIADYLSGDPYRQFAAASLGIFNPTEQQRQIYKAVVLGRIYGKGADSLARDLGISRSQAQYIMDQMRARYPVMNAWLERVTTKAAHCVPITCTLGWSLTATGRPGEERTFLNFPMQGNGSEMNRLVIVRASPKLRLIGTAHDGFLIEDTIDRIEAAAAEMQKIMCKVSRDLLGDFELRADCKPHDIVRFPDRFIDKREREDEMRHWNWLMTLIEEEND